MWKCFRINFIAFMAGALSLHGLAVPPKQEASQEESTKASTSSAVSLLSTSSPGVAASSAAAARAAEASASQGQILPSRVQYASPTTDTGFKQLLAPAQDPEVLLSFLSAFVPDFIAAPVEQVQEEPVAIPALRQKGEKQTFMDLHVKVGHVHYILEMQVERHIYFDERALFYACSTYTRQFSEDAFARQNWYESLCPVVAIQVLDYDSNRVSGIHHEEVKDSLVDRVAGHHLPPGQYLKHYVMKDRKSGQEIDHLQIIQVELRRKRNLYPPRRDFTLSDWWLSLFKHAPQYTQAHLDAWEAEGIQAPPPIRAAFDRLDLTKWSPRLVQEYHQHEDMRKRFSSVLAVERAEGRMEGMEERTIELVRAMLKAGVDRDLILEVTKLQDEKLRKIERDLEEVVSDPEDEEF